MRYPMRMIAALIVASGAAAAPAAAQQTCTIRVESLQGTNWLIKGFDLLDARPAQGQFIVTFTHVSGPPCDFVPQITVPDQAPGLAGPGNQRAPYTLTASDNSSGIRVTGASAALLPPAQGAVIRLNSGEARSITYTLFVPPEGFSGDGSYSQAVLVSAVPTANGSAAFGVLQALVGVDVAPSARIGLAGQYRARGSRTVIDLGELREGPVEAPFQLKVQTTGRYDLTIESENAGKLKLPRTDWEVAYALSVDGTAVNLAGGAATIEPPASIDAKGKGRGQGQSSRNLPLKFNIIGDPTRQRAGTYQDVITISVAPKS
jgi:hypothetical protein